MIALLEIPVHDGPLPALMTIKQTCGRCIRSANARALSMDVLCPPHLANRSSSSRLHIWFCVNCVVAMVTQSKLAKRYPLLGPLEYFPNAITTASAQELRKPMLAYLRLYRAHRRPLSTWLAQTNPTSDSSICSKSCRISPLRLLMQRTMLLVNVRFFSGQTGRREKNDGAIAKGQNTRRMLYRIFKSTVGSRHEASSLQLQERGSQHIYLAS